MIRSRRARGSAAVLGSAVLLAMGLAGCGAAATAGGRSASSGSAAASPSDPTSSPAAAAASSGGTQATDVCALLSSAEASAINGVTYGATAGKHLEQGWDQCIYQNTGQHDNPVDIQNLEIEVLTRSDCWTLLGESLGGGPSAQKPVAGVGDAAFNWGDGLAVRAGTRCLNIQSMTYADLTGDSSHDIALANIVLGRLH